MFGRPEAVHECILHGVSLWPRFACDLRAQLPVDKPLLGACACPGCVAVLALRFSARFESFYCYTCIF